MAEVRHLNPYAVLDLPKDADMGRVNEALLVKVRDYNPFREFKGDLEEYKRVMQAYLMIRGETEGMLYRGSECPDWAPFYVHNMLWKAEGHRSGALDLSEEMIGSTLALLEELPEFIPGPRLFGVHGFDVPSIIRSIIDFEEFQTRAIPVDPAVFRVVWVNKKWSKDSKFTWGSCKPIPKEQRELWQGEGTCPLWQLKLNLGVWCLLSDEDNEREALVHHEMCHAKIPVLEDDGEGQKKKTPQPKGEGHTTEQFIETWGRYGVFSETEALAVAHAFEHPRTQAILKAVGWDPATGQGVLFPALSHTRRGRVVREHGSLPTARHVDTLPTRESAQTPLYNSFGAADPFASTSP